MVPQGYMARAGGDAGRHDADGCFYGHQAWCPGAQALPLLGAPHDHTTVSPEHAHHTHEFPFIKADSGAAIPLKLAPVCILVLLAPVIYLY